MKRYPLLFTMVFLSFAACSQENLTGLWEGKLNVGTELTLLFHINGDDSKNISVSIDCPEQGIKDLKASTARAEADSLFIEVKQINGSYKAKMVNDSSLEGSWKQGASIPLNLKKVKAISIAEKPQTPQPPFPYKSKDLVYYNKDKSIQFGGTLTMPSGNGPFPAILLITGSGQQNRDEEIMGHKPFAVIADYLTRKGFAVLRVDDRGMGQTTGEVMKATSRDFANDAIVSLDLLKSFKEIDKKKIGLIGHSEGGMIAEMIAAERRDIDFIILLAGPGEKVSELMADQNEAVLTSAGLPKEYVSAYLGLYRSLLQDIVRSTSGEEAKQVAEKTISGWIDKTQNNIVLATTGIKDEASREKFIDLFVSQVGSPWFRYFLNYDPDPYIRKIHAKVLALNGDRDVQVISKKNLPGIEASLKKSSSPFYEVKEVKGLNHLFQHCTKCTVQEYGQLRETFAPEVLQLISEWLEKRVVN